MLLPAQLRAIDGPDNWGQVDWASASWRRGVRWRGSVEAGRVVVLTDASRTGLGRLGVPDDWDAAAAS